MKALETKARFSGAKNPDIQDYNANFVLNERAFPYQAEISARLNKALCQPEEKEALPKFYVVKGPMAGKEYELKGKVLFIGRSSNNDIQIKDIMVSRKHLKISRSGEIFSVEDLKSSNGTLVNGKTIEPGEPIVMEEGDSISVGNTTIQFGRIPVKPALDVEGMAASCLDYIQGLTPEFIKEKRSTPPNNLQFENLCGLFEQSLNINGMFGKLLEYILDSLPRIQSAAILLVSEKEDKRRIKEVIRKSREDYEDHAASYSRSLLKRLLKEGKTIKISNTTFEAQTDRSENLDITQTNSVLCIPIIIRKKIRAAIYINSVRGPYEGFRKEDISMLESMGVLAAVAIENSNLLKD